VFGISAFADAPFASFAGVQFSSVSETATATDAVSSLQTFLSTIAETGTATDSIAVAASTFNAPVVETATATDAISSAQTFVSAVSETGTSTDSISSKQVFASAVAEAGTATDAVSSNQGFSAAVAEAVTATDVIVGGFLWNLIDNAQTANWTLVSTNAVVIGMDGPFGGAAFSATPFAGLSWEYVPNVGWVEVTVAPATTWQTIGTVN
jgi:hypothetical protein